MSDSYESKRSSHGIPVGVNGMAPPKEMYIQATHNQSMPMRPGAMDAFKHPSLDMAGVRRPYWAGTPS